MTSSPFDDNHAHPWATDFVDLPELNARASDAVAAAIARVRDSAKGERADIASESLLVLGPAGAGKTHLFRRLRKKVGPRAVFVHLRPLIGTQMTPRFVLGEIVRQLDYAASTPDGDFRQLDALVGTTLAYLDFEPIQFPRLKLERVQSMGDQARNDHLDGAVEHLARQHPETDDTYARRLFDLAFTQSIARRRAGLAWLEGRDLEQAQIDRLGVASSLPEERIVPALQTLGLIATPGAPIVLVFDQLENLMDGSNGARVREYANLIAELFDTMRGVVLVQMALDTEWASAIEPHLGATQKTRLGSNVEVLALPTRDQRRALVRAWLDRVPGPHHAFPAPFGEARLAQWCEAPGMTPRMLMIECKRAVLEGSCDGIDTAAEGRTDPGDERAGVADAIAAAWQEHVASARTTLGDASAAGRGADPARLVGGIACAFRFVDGASSVTIDAGRPIQVRVRKGSRDFAFALIHQKHPNAVNAALERARDAIGGAKVIVLREQALDFPPTWKQTRARLVELAKKGVPFLTVEPALVARLLALESFLSAARSGDVEDGSGRALAENDVARWIEDTLDVGAWTIARALDEDVAPDPPPTAPREGGLPTRPTVEACLAQLHVASIDRLVREVARARANTTRAQVLEALLAMGDGVRWFGRSIVVWREAAR